MSEHPPVPSWTLRPTVGWFLGRYRRVRVRGGSMWPTLREGQTVLVHSGAYQRAPVRVGDIVLMRHPLQDRLTLKRVASIDAAGLFVRGDCASDSTDSRAYGHVASSFVQGRVVCFFPTSSRALRGQGVNP